MWLPYSKELHWIRYPIPNYSLKVASRHPPAVGSWSRQKEKPTISVASGFTLLQLLHLLYVHVSGSLGCTLLNSNSSNFHRLRRFKRRKLESFGFRSPSPFTFFQTSPPLLMRPPAFCAQLSQQKCGGHDTTMTRNVPTTSTHDETPSYPFEGPTAFSRRDQHTVIDTVDTIKILLVISRIKYTAETNSTVT